MKTRRIKTQKIKKLIKSDIIMVVICIVINLFQVILTNNSHIIISVYKTVFKVNPIFGIILLIYEILRSTFFIWIIYIPYRIALRNRIIKNIRYEVINNIEYYRDKFSNLSPAEISIIADLDLEIDKDIAATILKLYGKKYIDFENEKIVVKNEKIAELKKSEQQIIFLIANNNLHMLERIKWKQIALQEAIEDGYIKVNNKINKKKHFWISTVLIFFSIYCILNSIMDFVNVSPEEAKDLEIYIQQEIYNEESAQEFNVNGNKESYENNLKYFNNIISGKYGKYFIDIISIMINIFIIFALIVYKVFRYIYYLSIEKSKYIRTELGEKLVEEIAAMQRYIHEFSLLSEKEKKDIELWEDFLVYAVVLEENTNIVKEIATFKNTDLSQLYKIIQGY